MLYQQMKNPYVFQFGGQMPVPSNPFNAVLIVAGGMNAEPNGKKPAKAFQLFHGYSAIISAVHLQNVDLEIQRRLHQETIACMVK